jgi:hypothetical protein
MFFPWENNWRLFHINFKYHSEMLWISKRLKGNEGADKHLVMQIARLDSEN